MKIAVLASVSLLLYLTATMAQGLFWQRQNTSGHVAQGISLIAWISHACVLYMTIDTAFGQNLSVVNLISLVMWLVVGVVLFSSFYQPVSNLFLLALPVTAACIIVAWVWPGANIVATGRDEAYLFHILLSMLAFSLLCVAGVQALGLAVFDYCLRHKKASAWLNALPAMETMEVLLFQFIGLGFILLTATVASSLWLFHADLTGIILEKTVLSLLSWCVFAALLWARFYYHWRGMYAIRYTLFGILILLLCCFSLVWIG